MSYPRGLDEYADEELTREIRRRDCARAEGKCSYCGRGHGLKPCRYPEQHKKTTPVEGAWHQIAVELDPTYETDGDIASVIVGAINNPRRGGGDPPDLGGGDDTFTIDDSGEGSKVAFEFDEPPPRTGPERFWVRMGDLDWLEVTEAQWIATERAAGFQPKPGCGLRATGGFGGAGGVQGKITRGKETA